MSSQNEIRIQARLAHVGHFEAHSYRPGRRGRDVEHAHADVQLCLSLNFPGRYRSGRWTCDVPVGAVSVVDSWEPHAAEDPCDRTVEAKYLTLYIPKQRWNDLSSSIGAPEPLGIGVHHAAALARAFAALHRCASTGASELEQDERLAQLVSALCAAGAHVSRTAQRNANSDPRLARARDYLQAHARRGVSLAELARECGVSPQHLSACFRARFGTPIHRFQTFLRLDHARRLLAQGVAASDVAVASGFTDQSHFSRHFKSYLGTTPGAYIAPARTS